MLTTCPGLHSIAERPGFELATYGSQVKRPNHSATEPHRNTRNTGARRKIERGTQIVSGDPGIFAVPTTLKLHFTPGDKSVSNVSNGACDD